jgi:hypothetical protein
MAVRRMRVLAGIVVTGILTTASVLRFWRLTWGLGDRELFFDGFGAEAVGGLSLCARLRVT